MTDAPETFESTLARLGSALNEQSRRVLAMCDAAFESFFESNAPAAAEAVLRDDEVDRADVAIERDSVALLCEVARAARELTPSSIREVLVIVKANNELERIADCAVTIAEQVARRDGTPVPQTFRVMANSVIGILRDVGRSLEHRDPAAAKLVLRSEDLVRSFKAAVLRDAETRIAQGAMTVDTAFLLHEVASACEHIADHATNIAEQVLYAVSGTIVRHCDAGWVEVNL